MAKFGEAIFGLAIFGPDISPVAIISANPVAGQAPLVVNFSAAGSYDPDGILTDYSWDFGDGSVGSGVNVSKVYETPGTYTVILTVTDNSNETYVSAVDIHVEPAPVPEPPPEPNFPYIPPEYAFLDHVDLPRVTYTFLIGPPDKEEHILGMIQSPKLDFDLKGSARVSFALNQADPAALHITELYTDLRVYRDGDRIFRGRVAPSRDEMDADGGYVEFTAVDYREVLRRRFIYDDDVYFWYDEDVSVIIWDLIDTVQSRTGGDLGITKGLGFPAVGVKRSEVEFTPGSSVTDALESIQESKLRGFEWEIDPELKVNVWAQRGSQDPKAIEWQGTIKRLTRDFKTDEFANAVRASGGEIPLPEILEADNILEDPRGRWEAEVSWPDTETQEAMNDRIEYLLEQQNRVPEEYDVSLREGFWQGREHIWLGDTIRTVVNHGRLRVNSPLRVHGISISPDGNGGEHISLRVK